MSNPNTPTEAQEQEFTELGGKWWGLLEAMRRGVPYDQCVAFHELGGDIYHLSKAMQRGVPYDQCVAFH